MAWKARWLSLAGKILLVKMMLLAIPNYYLSVLKAPTLVIQIIQNISKDFLWVGNLNGETKIPLVSLQDMTQVKTHGGASIHDMKQRSKAFGGKLVWKMYSKPDNKWCQIMQRKDLDNPCPSKVLSIQNPSKGSTIWNFMMASRDIATQYITWEVNSGDRASFWPDSWSALPPLIHATSLDDIVASSEEIWGKSLVDYDSRVCLFSKSVIWKDLDELPISMQNRI